MNVYSNKQRWKLVLSLLAIIISVASLFITSRLVKEKKNVRVVLTADISTDEKPLLLQRLESNYLSFIQDINKRIRQSKSQNEIKVIVKPLNSLLESLETKLFDENSEHDLRILEEMIADPMIEQFLEKRV